MEFTGEIARLQQRLTDCLELAERRAAVVSELAPRRGERILEIGCGSGLMLREIGLATGPHGLAAGLDISPDQIAAAEAECASVPAVRAEIGDACALPYPDGVFDAAVGVQVVEYVPAPEAALAQLLRVLKPGGRALLLATNWDSAFWHGPDPALSAEIARAWDGHAPHPNLPARLAPLLARAGFGKIRQVPVPIVNAEYTDRGFAWWLARLMAAMATQDGFSAERADLWLAELDRAEARGDFFFSIVPILTKATAA